MPKKPKKQPKSGNLKLPGGGGTKPSGFFVKAGAGKNLNASKGGKKLK